jgi:hypothetical protein
MGKILNHLIIGDTVSDLHHVLVEGTAQEIRYKNSNKCHNTHTQSIHVNQTPLVRN